MIIVIVGLIITDTYDCMGYSSMFNVMEFGCSVDHFDGVTQFGCSMGREIISYSVNHCINVNLSF